MLWGGLVLLTAEEEMGRGGGGDGDASEKIERELSQRHPLISWCSSAMSSDPLRSCGEDFKEVLILNDVFRTPFCSVKFGVDDYLTRWLLLQ